MEKKIKIFYCEDTDETKRSLQRYLKFVKNTQPDEIEEIKVSPQNGSEYFNKIYPAKFEGCELYFIFGEKIEQFENKNLTPAGLLFSILVDLSLSKKDFSYKLFTIHSDLENFTGINRIKFADSAQKSSDKNIEKECPESFFNEIGELFVETNDSLIDLMTHHSHDEDTKNMARKKIESLLEVMSKKDSSKSNNNTAPQTKEGDQQKSKNVYESSLTLINDLISNSIFVMVVDDVVGDYMKTFFPFYILVKSKLREKNKDLIMRGVADPVELKNYLTIFPADIVLVDIDFKEKASGWAKSSDHYYYYAEGANLAGIRIFEQLFYLRQAGSLFLKQSPNYPKLILFTGCNLENEKENSKQQLEPEGTNRDKPNEKEQEKKGLNEKLAGIYCSYIYKDSKRIKEELINELKSFKVDEIKDFDGKNIEDAIKKIVYLKRIKKTAENDHLLSLVQLASEKTSESNLVEENWEYFKAIKPYLKLGNEIKIYSGCEPIDKPIFPKIEAKMDENKNGRN